MPLQSKTKKVLAVHHKEDNNMRETDRIDDILLHYGVKGMRWGVRKKVTEFAEGKKAKRISKKISQADKMWERTIEKGIMNKYANDSGVSMEARYKAERLIKKTKTISRDQAQKIMTKAYADAINSRLKNDPQARNTTGNKQVRMEVVQQGRYIFMKPTIQELLKKPSKKRG